MRIILVLIIISVGSLFGSVVLNKRYEEMLPFSIFSIIISLYLFYILNLLKYGYYFILFSALILTIFSIYKFFRKKEIRKQAIANFFTPGLLIFAVAVIIIYFITKNNYVMLFDELRLWGAYPKALYSFEELMTGKNPLLVTNYLPGMPLFQYFFAKTVGYFAESHLFLSYGIVGLSIIIPVTKKITWKKYWLIIPSIILMIILPMLFANSGFDFLYYYKALFIDPMVGLAFGYSLYLSSKDLKKDKFLFILFCLSIAMPVLFKISGMLFSAIIFLSFLFHQVFVYKTIDRKKIFKTIIKLVLPLLVTAIIFLSWQVVTSQKPTSNGLFVETPVNASTKVILDPSSEDIEFLHKYAKYIKETSIVVNDNSVSKYYTLPNISVFFLALMLGLIFVSNKSEKKSLMYLTLFIIFTIAFSLLSLYVTFSALFTHNILCYERYICPVFSGLSVLILYLIVNVSVSSKRIGLYYFIISIILLVVIFNLPKISVQKYQEEFENISNNYSSKIETEIQESNAIQKVLTIYNQCDTSSYTCVLWQHHLYLSLIDDNILIDGVLFLADEDSAMVESSGGFGVKNNNLGELLKNYDYVFIVENIEEYNKDLIYYLGSKISAGDLYKINDENGKIKLEKLLN